MSKSLSRFHGVNSAGLLLALLICGLARADFSFALLGDTPYSQDEEERVTAMLHRIGLDDIAFIVHVGDFKDGWTVCSDAVYARRRELFAASRKPLVYLPGDNEWVDCSRKTAGGYNPLERLKRLREVFFSDTKSFGNPAIDLSRQSEVHPRRPFPEHARWVRNKVLFATFNMPGGDNNLSRMPNEHAARDAAARDWLQQTFALAERDRMAGVVVLIHANPLDADRGPRRGYTRFIDLLVEETARFDGQVLLVHGDTHHYRVDQPLSARESSGRLRNLTRVEVFGSPWVSWVRVVARESGERVRFEIEPGK